MPTNAKWFRISGTRTMHSSNEVPSTKPILFYVWETTKRKAVIEASQAKNTYLRQLPAPDLITFDFGPDIQVMALPKEWDPNQISQNQEDQIIIVGPKDGYDHIVKVIGEVPPSRIGKPQYIVLLKTATGKKVWTETETLIPFANGVKGSIVKHNRQKHILIDVLPAPQENNMPAASAMKCRGDQT